MHYLCLLARSKVSSRIRPCCDSSPILQSKSTPLLPSPYPHHPPSRHPLLPYSPSSPPPPPLLPPLPTLVSFNVIIAVQVILYYVTLHFHYLKAGLPLTACLPKEDFLRESPTLLAAILISVSCLPQVLAFWLSGLAHILWLSSNKSVQYNTSVA